MKKTKLTKKELLLKIFQLQKEITKKIENLNNGGCGNFTFLFYQEVIKFYPKDKVRIVLFDNWTSIREKKSIIKSIKTGDEMFDIFDKLASSHCMIEIDKVLYLDGYYIYRKKVDYCRWDRCTYKGYVTLDELHCTLEYGFWNDDYDTDQNSKLHKIIKKHFKVDKKKVKK